MSDSLIGLADGISKSCISIVLKLDYIVYILFSSIGCSMSILSHILL